MIISAHLSESAVSVAGRGCLLMHISMYASISSAYCGVSFEATFSKSPWAWSTQTAESALTTGCYSQSQALFVPGFPS